MTTTRDLLDDAIARLRAAGVDTPRLDAEVLYAHAVHADRTTIVAHPEALVGMGPAATFEAMLERRLAGEPVAYIRGVKEFHGIALTVDPRVLIPRPETELLVDLGVEEIMRRLTAVTRPADDSALGVLDIGTGSGAVAIALAVELRRRRVPVGDVAIVASDVSEGALELARENAVGHGVGDRVTVVAADLVPLTGVGDEAATVVLANLPYVRTDAMATLPVAATFEPPLALDGGPDGLAVIARLLKQLPTILPADGVALLEIGSDGAEGMRGAAATALPGWTCRIVADLAGLPRVARLERAQP